MGFPRQEYWIVLPFPSPVDGPDSGIKPRFLHWQVGFFCCCCLFVFWPRHTACGILVPQPGTKSVPPAVEAWSLNHWNSGEVLTLSSLNQYFAWLAQWFLKVGTCMTLSK